MAWTNTKEIRTLITRCYQTCLHIFLFFTAKPRSQSFPSLFYAGARTGTIGGTLVKIMRLQQFFPQSLAHYNLIYLTSNTSYLSPSSLHLLKRRRLPLILNQNGVYYPAWYRGDYRRANHQMSHAYHLADFVFWQSKFCRRSANLFLGERYGPGEILYNALDTNFFRPQHEPISRPFTLLATGKFGASETYRLIAIIQGFSLSLLSHSDIKLRISGYVSDLTSIICLIESLNLSSKVLLTGPYSQSYAPSIYQSADAYITTTHQDSCPNAVIEALSCGLPVIYSCSGGTPELVGTLAGIPLSVPEDYYQRHVPSPDSIAEAISAMISSHSHLRPLARNRAVEKFSIASWIEKHNSIFNQLLNH